MSASCEVRIGKTVKFSYVTGWPIRQACSPPFAPAAETFAELLELIGKYAAAKKNKAVQQRIPNEFLCLLPIVPSSCAPSRSTLRSEAIPSENGRAAFPCTVFLGTGRAGKQTVRVLNEKLSEVFAVFLLFIALLAVFFFLTFEVGHFFF